MFSSDKEEHFSSFLSNRALRINRGISDFKNKEVFSKLLNENKKPFFRSLALNASLSPIETFRHAPILKGWYQSGPVQYRVSTNIFNATASLFKGFSFNQREQTLGVIPKKDHFFTGQVFRDEVNDQLYRVSQLIAHVNSVDCYSVHPVEIESIVHDFMARGSSPLAFNADCSGGKGKAGCYLALNWEPIKDGQDPASAGATAIDVKGISVYLGAYVHGEMGFSSDIKVFGTSSIDFYFSYGYTAQAGFSLSEINIDEYVFFSKCFGIPNLYYEVKILTKKFAIGVSVCGDLAVTNFRFKSNKTLIYKRTYTAKTAKHFAITTKGPRTFPDEYDFQNLFDSNIKSGSGGETENSNKITLEFTPEIRLYGKLEITFAGKSLIDLRVGMALGTPFHFTLDTKLCTAPALIGNIGVVFRAFISFEKLSVLGYTILPGFSESKELYRIDSLGKIEVGGDTANDKCFVSSSQNSFELNDNYLTGPPADLMVIHAIAAYWENQDISQANRWIGSFPINLNVYSSVSGSEVFVNSLSFGSVTLQAENDLLHQVKVDRIVIVRAPARNYEYYFQVVDPRITPENGTQSNGKPFESEIKFGNVISQNQASRVRVNGSHIINIVYNTYPSNETIFGKETPPLKELRTTFNDLLPKAFGSFTVSSKAILGDKFTVIQHNNSTPYICDPNVLYIDSLSQSIQNFETGKFTSPGPNFPKITPLDYIHASGKAVIKLRWKGAVTGYNYNWDALKLQTLTILFEQVNTASGKTTKTSSIIFNLKPVARDPFYSEYSFDSNQVTNISGFPSTIEFDSYSLVYTIKIEGFQCKKGKIERDALYVNDFKVTFNLTPEDIPSDSFCLDLPNGNDPADIKSRVCATLEGVTDNRIDFGFTSVTTSEVAFQNIDNIPNVRRIVAQLYEMEYVENENPPLIGFGFLDGAAYVVLKLKVGEKMQGQNRLVFSCEIDFNPLCEFSWISRDTVIVTLEEGVTKFTEQKIIQIPIRFTGFTGVASGNFHTIVRFRIYRLFYGVGNTICSPFSIISAEAEGSVSEDFGCVEHPRTNYAYAAETNEAQLHSSFTFDSIDYDWRLKCWNHTFINKTEVTIIQTYYLFPEYVPYMILNALGNVPVTVQCSRCSAIQNGEELVPVKSGSATFKPKVDNISAICDSVDSQYCISKLLLGDSKQAFLIQYEKQGLVVDIDESNYSILNSFIDQQIVYDRSNLNLYKDWSGNISFQPIKFSDQLIVTVKVVLISANTVELTPFLNGLKIPFSHQKYSDAVILSNQIEEQSNTDENSTVFSFTNEYLDNLYFQGYPDNNEFTFQTNGSIIGPAFYFKGKQDSFISPDLFDLPDNYAVNCVCFEIENQEIRCKPEDSSSSSSTVLIVSLVVVGAILVVAAGVVLFFFLKKKFSNDDQGEFEKDI